MSGIPYRPAEVWTSSTADELGSFTGVFLYEVAASLMVGRSVEHLRSLLSGDMTAYSDCLQRFISGSIYAADLGEGALCAYASFAEASELRAVTFEKLESWRSELELHLDINLTCSKITFLADLGSGPREQLQVYQRRAYTRGVAFRLPESEQVNRSISQGDVEWPPNTYMAQVHYSSGMALLAAEDGIAGLLDGAFMQFYLAIECALGVHERWGIKAAAKMRFPDYSEDLATIAEHVYEARHCFFGHGHPKYESRLWETDRSFAIAKQVLVARWCARSHISLLIGRPLLHRAMMLRHSAASGSFSGDLQQLASEFALPIGRS